MIEQIKNLGVNAGKLKSSEGGLRSGKAVAEGSQVTQGNGHAAASDDGVRLSEEGKQLDAVTRQLAAQPEVDSAKVAAIKAAVDSGDYQINFEQLANRIVDSFSTPQD